MLKLLLIPQGLDKSWKCDKYCKHFFLSDNYTAPSFKCIDFKYKDIETLLDTSKTGKYLRTSKPK